MKFEAFKAKDGQFRWQLRNRDGSVVPLRAGRVMLPPTSARESQRLRKAMQTVLQQMAAANEG